MRIIKIKNDSGQAQTISGSVLADQDVINFNTYRELEDFRNNSSYIEMVSNQNFIVQNAEGDISSISEALAWLFQDNPSDVKIIDQVSSSAFASKSIGEKRLFKRVHGVKTTLSGDTVVDIVIPYNECKVDKIEILWAPKGLTVDFKVYDTPAGTITSTLAATGYTAIPNFMLNQFGFDVGVAEGEFREESKYDADLIKDMKLELTIKNPANLTDEVCVNFTLHELKL